MTFRQRLMYYSLGIVIGLFMVAFFFSNRGCGWTPGNRVVSGIAHSQIMISDSMRCVLKNCAISDDDIYQLFSAGSVNFNASDTKTPLKKYLLEGKKSGNPGSFGVYFLIRTDSISEICGISPMKFKNDCQGLSAKAERIFVMPERTIKKILNAREIIATDSLKDVVKSLGVKEGEIFTMIKYGKVDLEKSMPLAKPHPVYFLSYKAFYLSFELAEERAYLVSFEKRD